MMDITTVLILFIIFCLGYWLLNCGPRYERLPPGPSLWRILRMTYGDSTKLDIRFQKLLQDYGPIISFEGTSDHPAIIISSYDLIKEVFVQNSDYSSNKPNHLWLIHKLVKNKGILFNSTTWKDTRKFALQSMKDFGLGKYSIEERIQNEALAIVNHFKKTECKPFDPKEDLSLISSNIISSITFGKRYDFDDEEFLMVRRRMESLFACGFMRSPLNRYPNLRHLGFLHRLLNMKSFEGPFADTFAFVRKIIVEHRETYDEENIRDLVDLYIQAEKNNFKDMKNMDEEDLFQVVVDLFLSGTETTCHALRWVLLHLINSPDKQKKCQEEIIECFGYDKIPEYKDTTKLPYTVAAIYESMRISSVVIGTLSHTADKEMEVGGYIIPKGSTLMGLTRSIMFDTKIWGPNTELYQPERWLDENGQLKNIPEFIIFGIGRRACLGEQLARTELFIETVVLLQNFTFKAEDPEHPPDIKGKLELAFVPLPFKIIAVPNNS